MASTIDWQGFTWPAFATLATGLAAVAGAVLVGFRQVGIGDRQVQIAARQADIADRQMRLAELKLKQELFDRRYDVYVKGAAFLASITPTTLPDHALNMSFLLARGKSRFLFKPPIHEAFGQIWDQAERIRMLRDVGSGLPGESPAPEEVELLGLIAKRTSSFGDLFGDELRLLEANVSASRSPA